MSIVSVARERAYGIDWHACTLYVLYTSKQFKLAQCFGTIELPAYKLGDKKKPCLIYTTYCVLLPLESRSVLRRQMFLRLFRHFGLAQWAEVQDARCW